MSDAGDRQAQYEYEQAILAAQWAAQQEAARLAALTPAQRSAEIGRRLQALPPAPYGRNRLPARPDEQGSSAFEDQEAWHLLNYQTTVPTPYLGPTTGVNPFTGHYVKDRNSVGPNIAGVGRAGTIPGTQDIVDAHLASKPKDLLQIPGDPFPKGSMGSFELGENKTEEEAQLEQLAASHAASPGQLQRLARLRASRFEFQPDGWKRTVARYYPAVITTAATAGAGAAAGGGLTGALVGAGLGGFSRGAQTGWEDPWGILAGAAGGAVGGWGAGQAASALGAGPTVTGVASGAGGGFAGAASEDMVHGQFDPAHLAKSTIIGGATGGLGGATGVPGSIYGPAANVLANTVWPSEDEDRRRRRNPFRGAIGASTAPRRNPFAGA